MFQVLWFWVRWLGLIVARQVVKDESGGLGVVTSRFELWAGTIGL